MIDIKIPVGLMFTILGITLTIYGLTTMDNMELYQKAMGINMNIWSGCGMLLFGIFMLILSKLTFNK